MNNTFSSLTLYGVLERVGPSLMIYSFSISHLMMDVNLEWLPDIRKKSFSSSPHLLGPSLSA